MDSDQFQTHSLNQIHTFQQPPEIFNFAAPNIMDTFFAAASIRGSINQTVIPSSSKQICFYPEGDDEGDDNNDDGDQNHLMETVVADHHHRDNSASWHHENNSIVDDSSLRCVFNCEDNERPSQGLSLSLSSANPSNIGLQSFELHQEDFRYVSRDGFYGKSVNMFQNHHPQEEQMTQFQLRNSKFLGPAQELLNEFCCLGTKKNDLPNKPSNDKMTKNNKLEDEHVSSKQKNLLLNSHELIELQKRNAKLVSLLEEVDRSYKHYCDQMKAVVSSFEAVAGNGAAKVYSALALKAMSRHFRSLRDGIVSQIQESNNAMGEKDTTIVVASGTTKGETPRLRLLDQTLRQQRAMQQMSLMESHPWRPQRGLPERSVSVLRAWLFEHFLHPYPSDVDKHILASQTGLSRSQVSNWFINARVRLWKPMVEEMYVEETKEHIPSNINNPGSLDLPTMDDDFQPCKTLNIDKKPTPDQLIRIDSECLSSIISTNPELKNDSKHNTTTIQQHQNQITFGRVTTDTYIGGMELDFSSYNHHSSRNAVGHDGGATSGNHHHFGGKGGGGGVSLTLGLQHVGSNFVGLGSHEETMFYTRDYHNIIDDCTLF